MTLFLQHGHAKSTVSPMHTKMAQLAGLFLPRSEKLDKPNQYICICEVVATTHC